MEALRELLAVFDIKLGDTGLKDAEKRIQGLKEQIGNFGTVLLGAFAVKKIADFVESTIDMGRSIAGASKQLGLTTDQFQEFRGAAALSGVDAEAFGTAMGFLNRNMGEALTKGGDSAAVFQSLKVPLKDAQGQARPLADVFTDLSDSFAKMPNDMTRAAKATELFGRGGRPMVKMLAQGKEGVAALIKEVRDAGGVLDSGFIAQSVEAGHEIEKFKMSINALKVALVVQFMPMIKDGIDRFRKMVMWLKNLTDNTTALKSGLIVLAGVGIAKVLLALKNLFKAFGMLSGFSSGEGMLAKLFSMGEVGLIIAAITALYLIFDDLFALFNGDQSAIGDVLTDMLGFDKANEIIQNLKEAWYNIADAIGISKDFTFSWMNVIETLVLAVTVLVEWWTVLASIVVGIVDLVAFLAKEVYDLIGALGAALKGEDTTKWTDEMAKDFDQMKKDMSKTFGNIPQAVEGGATAASMIPTALTKDNNFEQTNHIEINVNNNGQGGDNDTGYAVRDAVTGALRDFSYEDKNRVFAAGASRVQ